MSRLFPRSTVAWVTMVLVFTTGESKVPVLGDIPLIGRLFRYDSRKDTRIVRMFLIRPRILEQGMAQGSGLAQFGELAQEEPPEIAAIKAALDSLGSN